MYVFIAEISFPSALIQPVAVHCFWTSALNHIYLYNHCLPLRIRANSWTQYTSESDKSVTKYFPTILNLLPVVFSGGSAVLLEKNLGEQFGSFSNKRHYLERGVQRSFQKCLMTWKPKNRLRNLVQSPHFVSQAWSYNFRVRAKTRDKSQRGRKSRQMEPTGTHRVGEEERLCHGLKPSSDQAAVWPHNHYMSMSWRYCCGDNPGELLTAPSTFINCCRVC